MASELETALRAAMIRQADRSPDTGPGVVEPGYITPTPQRWPYRWVPAAAAATVVVAVAVGIVAVRWTTDSTATTDPPAFVTGSEVPLVAVDVPAGFRPAEVMKPGSATAVRIIGRSETIVSYIAGPIETYALEARCWYVLNADAPLGALDGGAPPVGGCRWLVFPRHMGYGEFTTPTGEAAYAYPVTWIGLPAGTAYVQAVDTTGAAFWQRPVNGIAAFPGRIGLTIPSLTAYDSNGRVLATNGDGLPQLDEPPTVADADAHPEWAATLRETGQEALRACLADHGATLDGPRSAPIVLPDTADTDTIWTDCLTVTKAAIVAQADKLRSN